MKMRQLIILAMILPIWIAAYVGLAKAGNPQAVWMLRDVLGVMK